MNLMGACRELGCPCPAQPDSAWCFDHQLIRWRRVPADLRADFATEIVQDVTTNASGCWLYAVSRNPTSGYAQARHARERPFLHRWFFWYLVGTTDPLDPDKELHHICGGLGEQDTRHCINPSHLIQLYPGDHDEETAARSALLAAAEPGARFYQNYPLVRGHTGRFAQDHDLPRLEARFSVAESSEDELVSYWRLVIPKRFGEI